MKCIKLKKKYSKLSLEVSAFKNSKLIKPLHFSTLHRFPKGGIHSLFAWLWLRTIQPLQQWPQIYSIQMKNGSHKHWWMYTSGINLCVLEANSQTKTRGQRAKVFQNVSKVKVQKCKSSDLLFACNLAWVHPHLSPLWPSKHTGTVCNSGEKLLIFELNSQSNCMAESSVYIYWEKPKRRRICVEYALWKSLLQVENRVATFRPVFIQCSQ